MIPRLIKPSKSNSFFLFGARGTGKSTFVKKQFLHKVSKGKILVLDLLLPEVEDVYARHPDRLKAQLEARASHPPKWVFIDEVQKVPRLLDVVHHLIETTPVRFILSGSSARKLKRGAANLLAGRAFIYALHPFTALELKEKFKLEDALQYGTLPKLSELSQKKDKEDFLRAYALTYLKEEIQVEQLVRRLDPFREFLGVAAQSNGEILNFSAIARDVGSVDHKTVQSYFEILADTHLGFLLPSYSKSIRKAQRSHPKFYFFDTGVKRALERTLDVVLKPQTYAFGKAFEHWVILEIFRLNQIFQRDYRLSHFHSQGSEIDLILSKPKDEILIEIKSNSRVDPLRVRRLAKLAQSFPHARTYFLSLDKEAQDLEGVSCRHWFGGIQELFLSK